MSEPQGIFVAVDGPKHVGKTTILDLLVPMLKMHGLSIARTKEPSLAFDLSQEERRSGVELAQLIADDRARHLKATIVPWLASYDVVITDRYIASSLVFQVLDGVPQNKVWAMNSDFPLPDLNIFLTADRQSIQRRLAARDVLTRFDRNLQTDREIALYATAKALLSGHGVRTAVVANGDNADAGHTAAEVASLIAQIRDRS